MTKKELNSLRYKLKPSDFLPTNNQEKWEERFDKKWKRIESSIKTHISGRKIWDTSDGEEVEDSWKYVDETLESFLRQEIRQAKIEEQDRILKEIWKMIEWNHKEENQWDAGISLGQLAQEVNKIVDQTEVPKGIMLSVGGDYEDMIDSFMDLGILMLISIILVFLVMASQFESFVIPFILMFSIPFSFTGVIFALLITNTTLSVIAGIGAVLLIGIVVKNGIVLVDYINLLRDRGVALNEAIAQACRTRLRPVLMTAFTTVLAMVPMALSTGEGAEIWKPMGVTIIGGLVFSTLVTLVLIPVMYGIVSRKGERDKLNKIRNQYTFINQK